MTIALLGRTGSRWLEAVAAACEDEAVRLDVEAPLAGRELVVDGERVVWQGFELALADAVLVERPAFSWPQPGAGGRALSPRADREARALIVSALFTAARVVRVIDPPDAAELAIAPLVALERCARAGLAVQPFELAPERPADDGDGWLDPAGEDLWLDARPPRAGEPAWKPERFDAPLLSVLTIGARVVGARRRAGAGVERLAADELDEAPRALALAAQRALGLSWLQTDLVEADEPRILRALPGVDLGPWERALEGGPSAAMAALLTHRSPTPTAR